MLKVFFFAVPRSSLTTPDVLFVGYSEITDCIKCHHIIKVLHVMECNFWDMWTRFRGKIIKKIFSYKQL